MLKCLRLESDQAVSHIIAASNGGASHPANYFSSSHDDRAELDKRRHKKHLPGYNNVTSNGWDCFNGYMLNEKKTAAAVYNSYVMRNMELGSDNSDIKYYKFVCAQPIENFPVVANLDPLKAEEIEKWKSKLRRASAQEAAWLYKVGSSKFDRMKDVEVALDPLPEARANLLIRQLKNGASDHKHR